MSANVDYRYSYQGATEVPVDITETRNIFTNEQGEKIIKVSEAIAETTPSTVVITGYTEVNNTSPGLTEFYVDYTNGNGTILFNSASVDGTSISVTYKGVGTAVSIMNRNMIMPVGTIIPIYGSYSSYLLDCWTLCNGAIVSNSKSPMLNKRKPNLNGSANAISCTGSTGSNLITLSANDILAINVGDTVSGANIPAGAIVGSISGNVVSLSTINGTWSGTAYTTAANLTGNITTATFTGQTFNLSSDTVRWDTMQGHIHGLDQYVSSGGASLVFMTSNTSSGIVNTLDIYQNTKIPKSDGSNGTPRTSSRMRERTFKIDYYIKEY